jgi:hypothetical protein
MRTLTLITTALAMGLVLAGCTAGILYTHTVRPLTLNQQTTPATGAEGEGKIKHIQLPYVGIMWGDTALGDVAKEKGLQEIYYADMEYLSVLTIWQQSTVHIYGK